MNSRTKLYKNIKYLHLKYHRPRVLAIAAVLFLCTASIGYFLSLQISSTYAKDDEIRVQNKYIYFQNEMTQLIKTAENIIIGYQAFYMSSDIVTPDETESFLSNITPDYTEYIRNVGILENTTIIFNYPTKENSATIGIDLSTVEGQRDSVLKVKNEGIKLFEGPVDLIQGGQGYIIRVPILNKNKTYWGQASIVLKADAVNQNIMEYADENNIDICIFSDENAVEPIIGDIEVMDKDPYRFELSGSKWIIYAISQEPSKVPNIKKITLITSLIFSVLISAIYISSNRSRFRLKYIMTHDQLTDLYNRRYLDEVQQELIKISVRHEMRYGLLHIDLDNFKYINDHYGHLRGDDVLSEISRILKKISRKNELVFRIGGDEFLILIPEVMGKDELKHMRERYLHDFAKEFESFEYNKIIGISIGISGYPKDGSDFDSVLKAADADMYEQKKVNKQERVYPNSRA
ncbi:MAG: diguanylate cyclase [Lachnospiraceae bacterium]